MFAKKQEEKNYDPYLMEKMQPEGGISFKNEKYTNVGHGWECCIHIYGYPEELNTHWMGYILNIKNTVAFIDVHTEDMNVVKANINKSMNEQKQREVSANDFETAYDAKMRYEELQRLWVEIQSMGEVIKSIQSRVFVYAYSVEGLESICQEILVNFETNGYKAAIFLNEGKEEFKSMYIPYTQQQKSPYAIDGQVLTAESLAAGYPFHFSSLEDPLGTLLGYTTSGGMVLFDHFHKDATRLSYSMVVLGKKGSGKSTILKKFGIDRLCRGDFVRFFDIAEEFGEITELVGGKTIKMDGSDGIINILQILHADEEEHLNYTQHLSKINTWWQLIKPKDKNDVNYDYDLAALEDQIQEVYIKFGILPKSGEVEEGVQITNLANEKYPILSDLKKHIDDNIESLKIDLRKKENEGDILIQKKLERLDRLSIILKSIVKNYGKMFDGHTSLLNTADEQCINFDFTKIKNMKANIFDAQYFNAISLCWDNAVVNGTYMKNRWNAGHGDIDWRDIVRFNIIQDECHRFLNTTKIHAIRQILAYCREDRKFFISFIFATQNIRDFFPVFGDDATEEVMELKTLFGLMQYKFIFQQDPADTEILRSVFDKQLTSLEIERIPSLDQGETIMAINAKQNMELKVELRADEEKVFRGGA